MTGWDRAVEASGRRDIFINLIVFIPLGFTGYLWRGWGRFRNRWAGPLLSGALLSLTVETLQHYFPPRQPGPMDVVCNTLSTFAGIALGASFEGVMKRLHVEWRWRRSEQFSSALLLLMAWAGWLGWPTHAFPLGSVTRARALLHPGEWSAVESLNGGVPWLAIGVLMAQVVSPGIMRWLLWAMLPAVYAVRLLSPGHDFTWSHVLGAAAVVGMIAAFPPRHGPASSGLAWIWLMWIGFDGLRPFQLAAEPGTFGWIPFRDMLTAEWMSAIGMLLRKTWIYGTAFWLLSHSRLSRAAPLLLLMAFLGAIEVAQLWLPKRSAGLTDPAIALLAGILLTLVDRRFRRGAGEPHN